MIEETLKKHKLWVEGKEGGVRANLYGANLPRANLPRANLSGAYLSGAYLSGANLSGANLSRAHLSGTYLSRADLSGAYLSGAYLSRADLSRANLSGADLSGAYLTGANLSRANLSGADMSGAYLPNFSICPEEGDFIGWKKVQGGVILKLLIPASAKRTSSLVGRKCRAEFVIVLEGEGLSGWGDLLYKLGNTVHPDKYDPDIRVECTSGIHFFITRKEAEEYIL
jgi:hypothetical protein